MSEYQTKIEKTAEINAHFNLWFKKFELDEDYSADFNIFIAFIPTNEGETKRKKTAIWEPVMIMFTRDELKELFKSIIGDHFYFTFDKNGKIFITRGLKEVKEITEYEFKNTTSKILNFFEKE